MGTGLEGEKGVMLDVGVAEGEVDDAEYIHNGTYHHHHYLYYLYTVNTSGKKYYYYYLIHPCIHTSIHKYI